MSLVFIAIWASTSAVAALAIGRAMGAISARQAAVLRVDARGRLGG